MVDAGTEFSLPQTSITRCSGTKIIPLLTDKPSNNRWLPLFETILIRLELILEETLPQEDMDRENQES